MIKDFFYSQPDLAKSLITTFSTSSHHWLFSGLILCCSQSGDDPPEDLTRFGYKINIKANFLKISFFYIVAVYLRNYDDFSFKKNLCELWLLKSQKALDF